MFAMLPRSAAPALGPLARAIHELLQIQTEWLQERVAGQGGQSAALQGTGRAQTCGIKFTSLAVFAPVAEIETVHHHIRAALFRGSLWRFAT